MNSTRAWQFQDGRFKQVELPLPDTAGDAVRVKVHSVLLTDDDIDMFNGGRCDGAMTPGSTMVGTVQQDDSDLNGQRVVANRVISCGDCDLCRSGLAGNCRNRRLFGLQGHPGCLAGLITLPRRNLVTVPEGLDDDIALFSVPLGDALRASRLVTLEGRSYVTVIGDSQAALLAGQLMSDRNASVRVIGSNASSLDRAARWGLKHRLISQVGRRSDQDVVIDCIGTGDSLELAMQMTRPRGTILLTRSHGDRSVGQDMTRSVVDQEFTLTGSSHGDPADAMQLLMHHQVDVTAIIGRRYGFQDVAEAFKAARDGDPGVIITIK